MPTVSGKWVWNDFLNLTKFFTSGTGELVENVNCTVNGINYHTVVVDSYGNRMPNYITLTGDDDTTTICNTTSGNTDVPIYAEYKSIDFGSTEQEVSENFYNGLLANAVQQEEPVVPTTTKTVSSDNLARFKQKCDETYAKIGDAGANGKDALTVTTLYTTSSIPNTGAVYSIPASLFNRTPVADDEVWVMVKGVSSLDGRSWITICKVENVTSDQTTMLTVLYAVETTGATGANGTNGKSIYVYQGSPNVSYTVGSSISIALSGFSATPAIGDDFVIKVVQTTAGNPTYLCTAKVTSISADIVNATITSNTPNLHGEDGTNGTDGTDGKDALIYSVVYDAATTPSAGIQIPLEKSKFNREPVVGETISNITCTYLSDSYLLICSVRSMAGATVNCQITSAVKTTGAQGPAGSDANIEYMTNEEVRALFN